VLIARSAWSVLTETVDILMEATPRGIDVAQIARDMVAVSPITDVHDLHVWSIAGGMTALSAHVQVAADVSLSDCDALLERIDHLLADRYQITHSTIQVEYACCDRHEPDDLYCGGMGREGRDHARGQCDHADHDHASGDLQHSKDGVHIHV
jgi:cobalt-zinc-cadmium efflux system protein